MPSGFLGGGVGPRAFGGGGLPNPVPLAGAELLTNGNMETGSPPTGWSGSDATLSSVAEERPGGAGAKSIRLTNIGASGWGYQETVSPSGTWLRATGWGKSETANAYLRIINASYAGIGTSIPGATTWTQLLCTARLNTNGGRLAFVASGAIGDTIVGDDASLVPLTLSSLLSTRAYASPDCDLSAAVTRTAGTQAGFVARLDSATNPQNFILSYLDGAGNLKTDTCIAGTYANVAGLSGAVTYVAGRVPRLVCNGTAVSVYYNGVQIGSTTTVTHVNLDSNVRHGKFSTYASNVLANYLSA